MKKKTYHSIIYVYSVHSNRNMYEIEKREPLHGSFQLNYL